MEDCQNPSKSSTFLKNQDLQQGLKVRGAGSWSLAERFGEIESFQMSKLSPAEIRFGRLGTEIETHGVRRSM